MYRFLTKIKVEKKAASIYSDSENDTKFNVGYIIALNPEQMLLKNISPGGEYDGYMWLRVENVFRCSVDGKYEEKILQLGRIKDKRGLNLEVRQENILEDLLTYAMKEKRLLEFVFLGGYIAGYILGFSEGVLEIQEVNEYGKMEGVSCIIMGIIDEIHLDSITCREVERLKDLDFVDGKR